MLALHLQVHVAGATASAISSQTALPNCPEKCGNITVPYPFGIGDKCHYSPPVDGYLYNLTCDESTNPPRLIYVRGIEILMNVRPQIRLCEKPEYCVNQIGNYTCKCPPNYHGNGTQNSPCISDAVDGNPKSVLAMIIIFSGTGIGITVSIVLGVCLYWRHQKQLLVKARRGFFRRNVGHLLHQKLSDGQDVSVDMVKIFKIEELEKATNKYSDSNVIGKGGFGVVYKGILANNQVVAIKKSLKVDADQSEQFVNEVIVLSQLNNRHVVKILGCLETEVPLLVYEFIDNGTLYDHLHDETKASLLSWDIRLRIAVEVAEVLSYLHTTISIPIIHRDMKSMNILLDKNYMAKVSDFGASRLVPMDQENLATMVLGTYGYLDPEYFQTSELTQKSDVYSFGVVLVELLTRQRVVSFHRPENDRCLAFYFLRKLKEERLEDILDNDIVMEVADLAQRCLYVNGDERPTMKEVAAELQRIGRMSDGSRRWSRSDAVSQEQITQESIDDSVGCYTKDSSSIHINSSLYNSLAYGR
uniref:Protein kinase domain-containing protein n=1 Tax=Chenopodium quinoa TaxID=63459 RepID=A0A803NEW9_CHEQI